VGRGSDQYLAALVAGTEDGSYCLLRYIDPYAHTVFNQLQLDEFLREWARLRPKATAADAIALLDEVQELASECQNDGDSYLKFLGD
jgi:hypothetical protein